MKCRSLSLTFAALALASLGFADRMVAGERVPFTGYLEGNVVVTPVTPPAVVDVFVDASGTGTHLGRFRLAIPHRVDRSQTPPIAVGTYVFEAANGDEISADFFGESMLVAPGLLHIVETATITGGTGRFEGATGSFVCERWFDTVSGTTIGEYDGTISSIGSN